MAVAELPREKLCGEPELWDGKWHEIAKGPWAKLFTRGRPTSDRQRIHFLYAHDLLTATMGLLLDAEFVEIGAGRGTTSQYLAARGASVTLVDRSQEGFKLAAHNWRSEQMQPPRCVLADAASVPLPDGFADCVFSIGLLEHYDDPSPVIAESWRLLKSGGLLWKTIYNEQSTDVERRIHTAEEYIAWCALLGIKAKCRDYPVDGVLLLWATKP